MDKYVAFMKQELKSLPKKRLNKLMKQKYVSVIFSFLREKQFGRALEICKANGYTFSDYCFLFKEMIGFVLMKASKKL